MKWIKSDYENKKRVVPVLFYIKTDHQLSREEEGDISGVIGGDLGDIDVSLTETQCTDDGECVYEVEGFLSTYREREADYLSDVEMAMEILASTDRNLGKNIKSIGEMPSATNF
jgi:hypothetical protein